MEIRTQRSLGVLRRFWPQLVAAIALLLVASAFGVPDTGGCGGAYDSLESAEPDESPQPGSALLPTDRPFVPSNEAEQQFGAPAVFPGDLPTGDTPDNSVRSVMRPGVRTPPRSVDFERRGN